MCWTGRSIAVLVAADMILTWFLSGNRQATPSLLASNERRFFRRIFVIGPTII
jgi:hypothetical protein